MAATYEPIATTTLGSAASSITFSSIPSTYTDLRIVLVGASDTGTGRTVYAQYNSDTGTNYSYTEVYGDGATAFSVTASSQNELRCGQLGYTPPSLTTIDIFSYAGSTYKTSLMSCANDLNGSGQVRARVGLWRSTSAINTIKVGALTGNLQTGTIATLYGIKAA